MKNTGGGPFIFCSHTMSVVGVGHALADGRSTRILSPAAGRSDDNHSVQSGKDMYQMYPRWCIGGGAVSQKCSYEIWGHRSPVYKKACPTQNSEIQNDAPGTPDIPSQSLQKATWIF